jgi:hypothetical protein
MGFIPNPVVPPVNSWALLGPTTAVTVASGQKMFGSVSMGIGPLSGNFTGYLDLCYQPAGGGALTNFAGVNASTFTLTATSTPVSLSGGVAPAAGTYDVGPCVSTWGTTSNLFGNSIANGWVLVTS